MGTLVRVYGIWVVGEGVITNLFCRERVKKHERIAAVKINTHYHVTRLELTTQLQRN